MRKTSLTVFLVLMLVTPPQPAVQLTTGTLIHKSYGHHLYEYPTATGDGRRIYFVAGNSGKLFLYDRDTRKENLVISSGAADPDLSPAGDLLAFSRHDESGDGRFIYTMPLETRTGLGAGAPRRVSLTKGRYPSFSPDGRSLAFAAAIPDSSSRIVIIPVAGGPERLVTQIRGEVWPIRWTPDGQTIFFGVSHSQESTTLKNALYRVPSRGGDPQLVARTYGWGAYPGLTPDGRHLVFWEPTWDSTVVLTVDGKHVRSYIPGENEYEPKTWIDNGRGLGRRNIYANVVNVAALAGGTSRALTDSTLESAFPRFSPDGRFVAALTGSYFTTSPPRIVIANADGSNRREIVPTQFVPTNSSLEWSPDARLLLFRTPSTGLLSVVDAATGRVTQPVRQTSGSVAAKWRSDSRALLYSTSDSLAGSDSTISVAIHEATLTGADRILRTLRLRCANSRVTCLARILDDSLIALWDREPNSPPPLKYRVVNFRAGGAARHVYTRKSGAGQANPTFSQGGKWMAVRYQTPSGENRMIDVVSLSGGETRSVTLPFATAAGTNNPWVAADGQSLIISSSLPVDTVLSYHRVDVASGRSTRLTSVRLGQNFNANNAVSPDGRFLAYTAEGTPYVAFYEVDASRMLDGIPRSSQR